MLNVGLSWILIRAIGVSDQQLLTLLNPFGRNQPGDEGQFNQLKADLRRMGHIIQGAPGNLASVLRQATNPTSHYYVG